MYNIYIATNEFICLQHYIEIYIIYTAEDIKHYASFVTYIVSIIRSRVNTRVAISNTLEIICNIFAEKFSTDSPN